MLLGKYISTADSHHTTYKFLSAGPKGIIEKMVQYQPLAGNLYNLAFGDWDETSKHFDDSARSNNNDREKILATVAFTILDFIIYHPQSVILVRGTSLTKTRLYQMAINKNWDDIYKLFSVNGLINEMAEPFNPLKNYEGFLVELKMKV